LGCHVVASNSNTEFIKKLYEKNNFEIEEVNAYRHINSDATKRGKQPVEVLCSLNI